MDHLAAVLFDRQRQLRVFEVAIGQPLFEPVLHVVQGEPGSCDAANQRKGERAIRLDSELARQTWLVPDSYAQHVPRSDHIVWLLSMGGVHMREHHPTADGQKRPRKNILPWPPLRSCNG